MVDSARSPYYESRSIIAIVDHSLLTTIASLFSAIITKKEIYFQSFTYQMMSPSDASVISENHKIQDVIFSSLFLK